MESASSDSVAQSEQIDIENTPEFQALSIAAQGKPERAMGDSVIPAEPPMWSEVLNKAQDLLQDPPHLSVVVFLIKATTHVNGFPGLHGTLSKLVDSLEQNWDQVQPLADPDDKDDPHYARVNLLRELSDDPEFIKALHRLTLVDVRGVGAFSARDIDISKGLVTGSEDEIERCQDGLIRGAFSEMDQDQLKTLSQSMLEIPQLCAAIDKLFDEHAGSSHGLSMKNLARRVADSHALVFEMAGDRLAEEAADAPPIEAEGDAGDAATAPGAQAASSSAAPSQLGGRNEVSQSLNQIIAYYTRHEPASPVAILAQRARDLIPKSFFEILQELAPNSCDTFSACLEALGSRPMAFLIEDSYLRFMSGGASVSVPSEDPASSAAHSDTQGTTLLHSGSDQSASINSRPEVLEALTEIDLFFKQNEPASPIPLIVAEMRKMVPKTFSELVSDFNRTLATRSENATEADASAE